MRNKTRYCIGENGVKAISQVIVPNLLDTKALPIQRTRVCPGPGTSTLFTKSSGEQKTNTGCLCLEHHPYAGGDFLDLALNYTRYYIEEKQILNSKVVKAGDDLVAWPWLLVNTYHYQSARRSKKSDQSKTCLVQDC